MPTHALSSGQPLQGSTHVRLIQEKNAIPFLCLHLGLKVTHHTLNPLSDSKEKPPRVTAAPQGLPLWKAQEAQHDVGRFLFCMMFLFFHRGISHEPDKRQDPQLASSGLEFSSVHGVRLTAFLPGLIRLSGA